MPSKVCIVKAMIFPVVMFGCERWTIKEAEHWRIYAFELWCWRRLLRVPWTARVQSVHHKGNWSWIFIARTDTEAEAPKLWPPDAKSQLIGKDLDAGKDWRQEEKGTTEDEMVGWHHWLLDINLSKLQEGTKVCAREGNLHTSPTKQGKRHERHRWWLRWHRIYLNSSWPHHNVLHWAEAPGISHRQT